MQQKHDNVILGSQKRRAQFQGMQKMPGFLLGKSRLLFNDCFECSEMHGKRWVLKVEWDVIIFS